MTDLETQALQRAARALIETDRLWGLEAVPVPDAPAIDPGHAPEPLVAPAASPSAEPPVPTTPREAASVLAPAVDPAPLADSNAARLESLESLHARDCGHCSGSSGHANVVFGEGNPEATVMFVGEAPGAEEDRTGRPFVGEAGKLLDRMMASVGLERPDVYIGNIVKVRPAENRTPRPDECEVCGPWLLAQIAAIRPRVVVALGGTPSKYLLQTTTGITRLRGIRADVEIDGLLVPVVPTFHPAYVLRQYTPEVRRAVWEDLKQAVAIAGD